MISVSPSFYKVCCDTFYYTSKFTLLLQHSFAQIATNCSRNMQICEAHNVRNAQIGLTRSEETDFIIVGVGNCRHQTGTLVCAKRRNPFCCTYPENLEQEGSPASACFVTTLPTNMHQEKSGPFVVRCIKETSPVNRLPTSTLLHSRGSLLFPSTKTDIMV